VHTGMTMPSPVLFLVERDSFVRADPAAAQVRVNDLGLSRGDGVFESLSVVAGVMPTLSRHLERFASSAFALGLPAPDAPCWAAAIRAAIEAHDPVPGLAVTLLLSRGVERDGHAAGAPTGWVYARAARDFAAVRESGIRAVTLDRGFRHDASAAAPWLLLGAKHLSYAVNAAALREAVRRGADDAIFVSSDGFALEGPTSSLIVRFGDRILTPSVELGILAGTTQERVLRFFAEHRFETGTAAIPAGELPSADALWLVSSVRQAVAITALDGRPMPGDAELTRELNAHLGRPAP
jgi:4-amino-4-deoxychorismate lyase